MYLDINATTFFGGSHWLKALKLFHVGSTASPTLASETCKSPMSEAFYVWFKLEMFEFSAELKLLPAWGSSAASSCQHRAAAWAWPCFGRGLHLVLLLVVVVPIPVVGLEPLEMLPELAIEGSVLTVPGASAEQKVILVLAKKRTLPKQSIQNQSHIDEPFGFFLVLPHHLSSQSDALVEPLSFKIKQFNSKTKHPVLR